MITETKTLQTIFKKLRNFFEINPIQELALIHGDKHPAKLQRENRQIQTD